MSEKMASRSPIVNRSPVDATCCRAMIICSTVSPIMRNMNSACRAMPKCALRGSETRWRGKCGPERSPLRASRNIWRTSAQKPASRSSPGDSSCSPTNHTTIPPHSSTRISAACKEGSETQGSEGARRDLPRLSARLPPRRLLRREESHLQPPADPQHLGEHDRAKACEELCVAHRSVAQPDLKRPDVRGGDEEQKVGGEVEEAVESTGRNQSAAVSHLGGPDAQHRDEDGG
mmetsp:Transcript_35965/g.115707  ORF Transcript_35965/g.115707 Transcript_35965/m.115707 type:complete len:232 (+) Transcript_35965:1147-1842(+)